MNMTDPIADMLTRIRNGLQARHETVDIPASKEKRSHRKNLEKRRVHQQLQRRWRCQKNSDR